MLVMPSGIFMFLIAVLIKAPFPILVTPGGIETAVKEVHPLNTSLPIVFSPEPMETPVSAEQLAKAAPSKVITLEGIVALTRDVQLLNAPFFIIVILAGIKTPVIAVQFVYCCDWRIIDNRGDFRDYICPYIFLNTNI
jgi:hypothetical protein